MTCRVVLVHGFTQTSRSWEALAGALADEHDVLAVDLPGHGRRSDVAVNLWQGARLLGIDGGQAVYVGYSMGGRFCLHLALAQPDLVRALVLVGTTAGIEDPRQRAARRQDEEAWASALERHGVDAFLGQWLAQPLFAGLSPDAAGLEDRRINTAAALASSLRLAGTGTQESLWDRLGELEMPVLVMAGERDEKFRHIADRMAELIGANASVALIPGAGHACHLERPAELLAVLHPFLALVR